MEGTNAFTETNDTSEESPNISFKMTSWKWVWHYHGSMMLNCHKKTILTPRPPILFVSRGCDALLIMPRPQTFSLQKTKYQTEVSEVSFVSLLFSNGSFRLLKKVGGNFSKCYYIHNFLKMMKFPKKYFLQPFSIFWNNYC